MKRLLFLLFAISVFTLQAQHFEVEKTQKIKVVGAHYHPQFMPNGNSLLVTSETFDGLGIIDLSNGKYRQLTTMQGAGYMPAVQNDGKTVVYRTSDFLTQKISLYAINTENLQSRQIGSSLDHVNRLNVVAGDICYAQKGILKRSHVLSKDQIKRTATRNDNIYVTEEDLKVVIYKNGVRSVVDPLSTATEDVSYCWSSLSPDKTRLLFVGGNNAYTCNLDGSCLVQLGKLHAPVWRDNNYVVGMEDEDDGHRFTKSDIIIVNANGSNRQQLTIPSNDIKMYPAVSQDGNKIAYHTTDGRIYLMTIKEK